MSVSSGLSLMFCTFAMAVIVSSSVVQAQPSREADPAVIARLIAALDDREGEVRLNVALALANLGDDAVPALLEALSDSNPRRRAGAAIALGQIRPIAQAAIPALIDALRDNDDDVRRQVSYALSRMVQKSNPASTKFPGPAPNVPPPDPTPTLP